MPYIKDIISREILDSRGFPTIETDIITKSGITGRASVPSGASKGEHEALELRDKDAKRYKGKGVLKAIENINTKIKPKLIGLNVLDQKVIDTRLISIDKTENKSNIGANSILSISLSCCNAGANYLRLPLYRYLGGIIANKMPIPMANIINGGDHANNNLDIQEFMIIPLAANSFSEAVRWISEIFHTLKEILDKKGYSTSVGDEGGFAPNIVSDETAIRLIIESIEKSNKKPGEDVAISLDIASSRLYSQKKYKFKNLDKNGLCFNELTDWYKSLISKYPIISIEDAMAEDDWEGWKHLTKEIGDKIQIVGDDVFVTNTKRLSYGIKQKVCNAILIKPNQIGTLSETIETINMAQKAGYKSIISHRSGETESSFISDIAVAFNLGQIKTGSICRTDRTAKYNQLIRIEEMLGKQAVYSL